MKITIMHNEITTVLEYDAPVLLSDAFRHAGISYKAPCGGRGVCGKCLVHVSGALSPPSAREIELLSAENAENDLRLACMAQAVGDVFVRVPDTEEQILTSGYMPSFERSPWGLPAQDKLAAGIAVDVGTTTVAAYLYNLSAGTLLGELSAANPQASFGADVISRMEHALAGEGRELQDLITNCINSLIGKLLETSGIAAGDVTSAVITGNTAMLFFLCGEPVQSLAGLPFIPSRYFGEFILPSEIGLSPPEEKNKPRISLPEKTKIYLPRCIAAYVGADITAGIIAADLMSRERRALLVDIGTNGEMVLQTGEKLLCCSTAAGPAFEGAGIKMGSGTVSGAVKSVKIGVAGPGKAQREILLCETIGGGMPDSICGSGIVDAVAALLTLGAVEMSGRIDEARAGELGILCGAFGETSLKIAGKVVLTQSDLREIQLAKAAICAGMHTLLHHGEISCADLDTLFLAGGFGSLMNAQNAAAIGLIIPELAGKAKSIGNSAGIGAGMILQSETLLKISEEAAKQAETIELSTDKFFMEMYIDCMSFDKE